MRTSRTCLALAGAMFMLAPASLLSQTIYRCGNTYSQMPCPNAIVVRADDLRTPEQKAQTDAASLQAARLAERMQRDRLAIESQAFYASNEFAKGKHGQASTPPQEAIRSGSPKGGSTSRPKAKANTKGRTKNTANAQHQPPAPDPFIATARQDIRKKPANATRPD